MKLMDVKFAAALTAALLGLLILPLATEGQQNQKTYHIGFLGSGPLAPPPQPRPNWDLFVQGLRDRGYVEGRNLVIEYRWTRPGQGYAGLVGELLQLNVDLIVGVTIPASVLAQADHVIE